MSPALSALYLLSPTVTFAVTCLLSVEPYVLLLVLKQCSDNTRVTVVVLGFVWFFFIFFYLCPFCENFRSQLVTSYKIEYSYNSKYDTSPIWTNLLKKVHQHLLNGLNMIM